MSERRPDDEDGPDDNGDVDADGDADADTPPSSVVDEAERLTRQARAAVDPNEAAACRARRDELLAAHDYVARVRSEDRDTLVVYPDDWVDEYGTVRVERVDDLDRGIERPLSGPDDDADWEAIEAHNRAIAERIEREHGPVHGANAHAFADFMGNHCAKRVDRATPAEREEFLTEYFPRNAWPSDDQRDAVGRSLALIEECADGQ